MAALWALTGGLDPRRAIDGKVSDVVNDESNVSPIGLTSKQVWQDSNLPTRRPGLHLRAP